MFVIENASVFSGLKGFFDILWHQFVRNCYSIRPRQIHGSMNKTTQHFWREWLANGWWMAGEFSGSMAPGPARSATIGPGEGYAQCDRRQPQTISWSSWTCELVSRWVFRLFSLAKASSLLQDDVSMRFKHSDCNMSICLHIFQHVLVLCNMLSTLVQACCLMQRFEDTDPHQLSEGITTRSSHLRFASKKDQRTCAKKKRTAGLNKTTPWSTIFNLQWRRGGISHQMPVLWFSLVSNVAAVISVISIHTTNSILQSCCISCSNMTTHHITTSHRARLCHGFGLEVQAAPGPWAKTWRFRWGSKMTRNAKKRAELQQNFKTGVG